ncbi:MAG: aromatic-ring-hydroxylating dioxygenase subunit beta [Nocardioides alkalitolerans]
MTDTLTPAPARSAVAIDDPRVRRAIELVWHEADLLDRKEYDAWQALYADDAIYVIPIERDAEDFDDILNMVYDDQRMRAMRVTRMTEGHAIAAVDAAVTVRTVSRFVVTGVEDSVVSLRAAQVLVAFKRGTHDLWAGDVDYRIRLGADRAEDRFVRKVVRLVDADAATPAAGFLL